MFQTNQPRRRFCCLFALAWIAGCYGSGSNEQAPWEIDSSKLVPVKGVVTLNGKPLAKAVVAFMGSNGIPGVAETKEDGSYTLETTNLPGAIPGEYKVSISHLVSPDGVPQGLGARSALIQSDAMTNAVEQLPPEYSDQKQSKLTVKVGSQGGNFPFELKAPVESSQEKAKPASPEESNDPAPEKPGDADVTKDEPKSDTAK